MNLLTINTRTATTSGPPQWSVVPSGPAASNAVDVPRTMPAFLRADEAYYWSFKWQEDVREAMAARAAGDSVLFDSDDPNDAVRWLLDEDGDDEA